MEKKEKKQIFWKQRKFVGRSEACPAIQRKSRRCLLSLWHSGARSPGSWINRLPERDVVHAALQWPTSDSTVTDSSSWATGAAGGSLDGVIRIILYSQSTVPTGGPVSAPASAGERRARRSGGTEQLCVSWAVKLDNGKSELEGQEWDPSWAVERWRRVIIPMPIPLGTSPAIESHAKLW
jgi:hypothetical protein